MEDSLGLSILRVKHNGCLGAGCPPRGCRNGVRLMEELRSHFSTARASYITPQHRWESVCPCNGETGASPGVLTGPCDSSSSSLALQRAQ